jgi:hypothetical protein
MRTSDLAEERKKCGFKKKSARGVHLIDCFFVLLLRKNILLGPLARHISSVVFPLSDLYSLTL